MRKVVAILCGMIATALVLAGCRTQPAGQSSPRIDTVENLAASVALHTALKPSVHVVFAMAVAGQSLTGDGDGKLGARPALRMTTSVPILGQLSFRLVENVMYLKLPVELVPGRPWMRIDPDGGDPISKEVGGGLRELRESGDLAQSLKRFEGAAVITAQRPEQLNGKPTTHYSITINVRKVSAAAQTGPVLKQIIDTALRAGVNTFPVEVWLDQEYLPARTTTDIPIKNPITQQDDHLNISIDYSDWGKPVEISAPPPEQVAGSPR
ncbi:MAG TPA: hypothetical protein VFO16_19380 [Pseudonocardiaceae bacterium]|nr:hypothetical protein [Pseudonocardiaceae bacterium]